MIRQQGRDEFLLITQDDHARLAGQLAEHFGNDDFFQPARLKSTLLAIAMHDCGWPLHDDHPTLNPENLPLNVFETPAQIGVRVWTESARRAAEVDPYAGLLVSLHVLSLSQFSESKDRQDIFAINKFQHQEVERQEFLRRALSLRTDLPLKFGLAKPGIDPVEDQLAFDLNVLQAMDLISLALCCSHLPGKMARDILTRPSGQAIPLSFSLAGNQTLLAKPWPFDDDEISCAVPFKRFPNLPLTGVREFQNLYAAAPLESLEMTLHRGE